MLTPKQASALNPSPPTPANFSPSRPHLRDHYQPATRTQTADVTLDDSLPLPIGSCRLHLPSTPHSSQLLPTLGLSHLLHRNHLPNFPTLVQTQPKPCFKTGPEHATTGVSQRLEMKTQASTFLSQPRCLQSSSFFPQAHHHLLRLPCH